MAQENLPEGARVILTKRQLADHVDRLAAEVKTFYNSPDNLVVVVVLEGARRFAGDLLTALAWPLEPVYLRASSYHLGRQSTGSVKIETPLTRDLSGKNVLLLDDIFDTGLTLHSIINHLKEKGAATIQTCVMLEKERRHGKAVKLDFVGARIQDEFVFGYGLDFQGRLRELDAVWCLPSKW